MYRKSTHHEGCDRKKSSNFRRKYASDRKGAASEWEKYFFNEGKQNLIELTRLIRAVGYKDIDFFACKATDREYICHENATEICKYYHFRFAEDYETRLGYINPGVKLTFFRSDGSPYIDAFRGLEDSLALSFDYVKCN